MKKQHSPYKSLSEWKTAFPGAYVKAYKEGLLDKICEIHKWSYHKKKWTLEKCKKDAARFNSRNEWRKKSNAYQAAAKRNWINECCAHMIKTKKNWSLQLCKEDALKYKTKYEWQKSKLSGYHTAFKKGWIIECCSHMIENRTPPGYWTKDRCKEESFKFNSRVEWGKKSGSSYQAALKNKWLEDCCIHMTEGRKAKNA